MGKIDRLLCHPYRVFVNEVCEVLVKKENRWEYHENESVVIPVDSLEDNPDPYVFHNPWLYGYCRNYNIPKQTSPQSIIIFGTYLKDDKMEEKFLVDTVFVVESRYNWLGKTDGYLPSENFRKDYPFSKKSKLYKDFIIHRVEKEQHPEAKAIFAAKHLKKEHYSDLIQIPHNRNDKFYSFIPLNYDNGIYKLIDILPILMQKDPNIFNDYNKRQNRLYDIYSSVVKSIDYLIEKANRLVIKTSGEGLPEELDMELQKKYYMDIYNIWDESFVESNCKRKCKNR